jgi:hypothetical protein
MKPLHTLFFLLLAGSSTKAQTVSVSGQCISGTITLSRVADIAGRAAYQGTGTVAGEPGITVNLYWLPAPELLWVLDFQGQPYFQNACNTAIPPSTTIPACPWSAVSGNVCTGSSALVIIGPGTLPVELAGFRAFLERSAVQLAWKTLSEANNKGFEVQRSPDGASWTKIGFVTGIVHSSTEQRYSFTDKAPLPGTNYYRLVQLDLDNHPTLSGVVQLDFSAPAGYHLNTRTSASGIYQLTIRSAVQAELSITDMGGSRLLYKTGGQGVHLLDISRFAPGVYLLQLRINNATVVEKLVRR